MANDKNPGLDQYMRSMGARPAVPSQPDSRGNNIPPGARDWVNRMSAGNYRARHPQRPDQRKPQRK